MSGAIVIFGFVVRGGHLASARAVSDKTKAVVVTTVYKHLHKCFVIVFVVVVGVGAAQR